jgi:hypothetical protein
MAARTRPDPGVAMQSTAPRSRVSPILLVVLAVALAVGAAASLVAGAASTHAAPAGRSSEVMLTQSAITIIIVAVLVAVFALFLYVRLTTATLPIQSQVVLTGLVAVLVAVLLLALFHVLGYGGMPMPAAGSSGDGNSTSGTSPPMNTTGNITGPGGQLVFLSVHLPPWTLFAVVALAVIIGGAVLVPALWAVSLRRERLRVPNGPGSGRVAQVRGALTDAARELDDGLEPRAVVIRLYTALLQRVGVMVGGIEDVTPEEIRSLHLERLGIRAQSATTLTRLFEEARYSSHPMGPEAASRATAAISEALGDLNRIHSSVP